MKKIVLVLMVFTYGFLVSAQSTASINMDADKAAVTALVERFLTAIGNYDFDAMPELFSENANIGGVSFKNGAWETYTMSFNEFLEVLKSRSNPMKYTEPASKFTIHMDMGMLAFVKADAVLIRDGVPQSNNFDYFTLIKENGIWKILNGSYVAVPIDN
jgi:ketosteroid isomerase-like protein